jgi:transcriptional regulator with XRE-family HTH domain
MTRRAAIPPDAAGLPGGFRRRTPGLRREELAALAGVGVTWYTWLEQGRDIRVSAETLTRIADALRLSPTDSSYLFSLAGVPRYESRHTASGVDPEIQRALDGFTAGPAMLMTRWFDVEAYNRLADLVFEFDEYDGPFARNHVWRLFMDPHRRAKYVDWEVLAETSAGAMRMAHAQMLGDPYVESLVHELRASSDPFKRFWDAQQIRSLQSIDIRMHIANHGVASFTSVRFHPATASDKIFGVLPPADDETARIMHALSRGDHLSVGNAAPPASPPARSLQR